MNDLRASILAAVAHYRAIGQNAYADQAARDYHALLPWLKLNDRTLDK